MEFVVDKVVLGQVSLRVLWFCPVIIPPKFHTHIHLSVTNATQSSQWLSLHETLEIYPITGLNMPLGLQEVEAPRISGQLAHEGRKVVSPTHRLPLSPGGVPGIHFC